jgi:hypothetical protein
LQTVPDYRKARGKRHPLWIILVFMVMGNLAGYRGNRPLEEKANQGNLYRQLETLVRYRQPRQTASTPVEGQHGRQE